MGKETKTDKVTFEEVKELFLTVTDDGTKLDDVILIDSNAIIKEDVKKFIHEQECFETLRDYNLGTSKTMIYSGAPGTGKTFLARAVANIMHRPLYIVDIGELLKDTEGLGKLSKIFDFVRDPENQQCILFFDECDGIAKSRENKGVEEGVKRCTNKIMQELQEINSDKDCRLIVIAATNYGTGIDEAFLTRFQLQCLFYLPDNYLPFMHIEAGKNKMFELIDDVDEEDLKIVNQAAKEARFSIRELNAKIEWVFKQEIIHRLDTNRLDGETIPIKTSEIWKAICEHIKFPFVFTKVEPQKTANDIDFGD